MTSGGRKGATQSWPTEENIGVLKRYGRIIFADGETKPVKFAHYTMLSHALDGEAVEDKSCVLWVLAGAAFPSVGSKQAKQTKQEKYQNGSAVAFAPLIPRKLRKLCLLAKSHLSHKN